jgi:hypothetical protein
MISLLPFRHPQLRLFPSEFFPIPRFKVSSHTLRMASAPTPSRFLDLPAEIRLQIYEYLFNHDKAKPILEQERFEPQHRGELHPQILSTCRTCHREAQNLLYTNLEVTLISYCAESFFKQIGPENAKLIPAVVLACFGTTRESLCELQGVFLAASGAAKISIYRIGNKFRLYSLEETYAAVKFKANILGFAWRKLLVHHNLTKMVMVEERGRWPMFHFLERTQEIPRSEVSVP